jgi:hypothetical protein
MIYYVVFLIEVVVEVSFGWGTIPFLSTIFCFPHYTTNNQNGTTILFHVVQSFERNSVVYLVALKAVYVIGNSLTFSVLDYTKRRISDDSIKLPRYIELYSVLVIDSCPIHDPF